MAGGKNVRFSKDPNKVIFIDSEVRASATRGSHRPFACSAPHAEPALRVQSPAAQVDHDESEMYEDVQRMIEEDKGAPLSSARAVARNTRRACMHCRWHVPRHARRSRPAAVQSQALPWQRGTERR